MKCAWLGFLVLTIPMIGGCQKSSDESKEKIYDIRGKVLAVDPAKKKVTLDHEDIPGFMRAMKMRFAVESAEALKSLKPGDQVMGKLKVRSGEYILTEVKKQ